MIGPLRLVKVPHPLAPLRPGHMSRDHQDPEILLEEHVRKGAHGEHCSEHAREDGRQDLEAQGSALVHVLLELFLLRDS